jgi:segregation and condensation protein A
LAYNVSLKQFDGPLDLLLTLIGKARIDIQDIFVSEITEQYLEYMQGVDELEMDSASEFLQMAATLIEIKSRAMLPKLPPALDEDGLSPEEALVIQLTEYKRFKEAAHEMQKLEGEAAALYTKLPEEFALPPPEVELTGLTLDKLTRAFLRAMRRFEEERGAPDEHRRIRRDNYTVADCIRRIARRVKHGKCTFSELLDGARDRDELITMFLSVLEMVKHARLHVTQESAYAEIYLESPDRNFRSSQPSN